MNNNPPDRSHIATELRNPRSTELDRLNVAECVSTIQNEDRSIFDALVRAKPSLVKFITDLVPRFEAGGRLIYVGAGTSGRLGVLDASEAPPTFQIDPGRIIGIIAGGESALRRSSEGKEDNPEGAITELLGLSLNGNDTLLGIAAGGTTPYVVGALQYAEAINPKPLTGFLYCTPLPDTPKVDHRILLETGPEILTGSTRMKAGTATKMALNTISTTLMIQTGRVYQNLMVDLRATNDKLLDRAARIIMNVTDLTRVEALELLQRSEGSVKVAILMHYKNIDLHQALTHLERHQGRLRRVLEE